MEGTEIIRWAFEDYWQHLDQALDGLESDEIFWKPDPQCNSIGFLVWHLARVEDGWMTVFAQDIEHLWTSGLWYERLGMPRSGIGFHVSQEWLDSFPRYSTELLDEYRHSVRDQTRKYLDQMDASRLDFVPGRTPDPEHPASLDRFRQWSIGRMSRQVIGEINQHLGQVQYVRGIQRGLDSATSFNSLT